MELKVGTVEDNRIKANQDAANRVFSELRELEKQIDFLTGKCPEKHPAKEELKRIDIPSDMSFATFWGILASVFVEIQQRIDNANEALKQIIIG